MISEILNQHVNCLFSTYETKSLFYIHVLSLFSMYSKGKCACEGVETVDLQLDQKISIFLGKSGCLVS